MDTAASVDVLDSQTLESRPGMTTARDVMNRTVNVTNTGTGNEAPTVRGIDGTGPFGRAMMQMATVFAELERSMIRSGGRRRP